MMARVLKRVLFLVSASALFPKLPTCEDVMFELEDAKKKSYKRFSMHPPTCKLASSEVQGDMPILAILEDYRGSRYSAGTT